MRDRERVRERVRERERERVGAHILRQLGERERGERTLQLPISASEWQQNNSRDFRLVYVARVVLTSFSLSHSLTPCLSAQQLTFKGMDQGGAVV